MADKKFGIMQACLKVPFPQDSTRALKDACREIMIWFNSLEGTQVAVTANIILEGHFNEGKSYSMFWGIDSGHAYNLHAPMYDNDDDHDGTDPIVYEINTLRDLSKIPTSLEFQQLALPFNRAFQDSGVVVHEIVDVVYLFTKAIDLPSTSTSTKVRRYDRAVSAQPQSVQKRRRKSSLQPTAHHILPINFITYSNR